MRIKAKLLAYFRKKITYKGRKDEIFCLAAVLKTDCGKTWKIGIRI